MGTRFMATEEAPIHENVKQQIVDNDERATDLIFRTMRNTAAWPRTPSASRWWSWSAQGAKFEDVRDLVAGARGRSWSTRPATPTPASGRPAMIQGLIHDIPTCAELIHRIVREAEDIIRSRLDGMVGAREAMAAE